MASLQQELLIGVMRVTRKKKQWEHLDRVLAKVREQQLKGPATPSKEITDRIAVERDDSVGFPVFTLHPKTTDPAQADSRRQALYLHGGGFVRDFAPGHFKLLAT
jgi:acetyl esterase/lipase